MLFVFRYWLLGTRLWLLDAGSRITVISCCVQISQFHEDREGLIIFDIYKKIVLIQHPFFLSSIFIQYPVPSGLSLVPGGQCRAASTQCLVFRFTLTKKLILNKLNCLTTETTEKKYLVEISG